MFTIPPSSPQKSGWAKGQSVRAKICDAPDRTRACAFRPMPRKSLGSEISPQLPTAPRPLFRGCRFVLTFSTQATPEGGTDGGGRALEDLVLPRAQARERDDRRDALAA